MPTLCRAYTTEHDARDGMGSFAGDAGQQRRGAFADVDRDLITTYRGGVTRFRIARHHDLEGMLREAGLDEATATADVDALHHGRILVLVQSDVAFDAIAGVIDA